MTKRLGIMVAAISTLVVSNMAFADYYLCQGGSGDDTVVVGVDTFAGTAKVEKLGPLPAYAMECSEGTAEGVLLECKGANGRTLLFKGDTAEYIGSRETTQLVCELKEPHRQGWGVTTASEGEF